jgi:hypothetical protein
MAVDYEKKLTEVETTKTNNLKALDSLYGVANESGEYKDANGKPVGMIGQSEAYFQDRIDAVEDWEREQKKLQNEKSAFAIEKIEQQKAQAKKDYTKEQSGAYVDWQKQSNQYGANAEAMAAQGMTNTGYAESSQVSMYNTYQTRVTAAREVFALAVINYDNAIKDAQLQNSSILAEIAHESLQKQLELSLQGFQYKNQLILDKVAKEREIKNDYWTQYQNILAMQEDARQFNATMAENKRQFDILHSQTTGVATTKTSSGSSGGSSSKSSGGSTKSNKSASNSTSTSKKQTSSTKKSNNPEIDMQSVLALGYGPISEKRLSQLIDRGLVEMYVSGNKTKFRHSASYYKQKSLMG